MKKNKVKPEETSDYRMLVTAFDAFKTNLIKGVLTDNNILYFTDSNEQDYYQTILSGTSLFGTTFYVYKDSLEEARDLMFQLFGEDYNYDNLSENNNHP